MRAPEVGGGARSRRRLQLHHGFTANKTGVPASGGLSTLVPGALGPQRSRRSSRRPIPPGRSRPRRGSNFSIGPARAGPTRESALASARASAPPPAISESTCVHSLSLSSGAPTRCHAWELEFLEFPETYRILQRQGDWSSRALRPLSEPLLLCWKKCACLGPSRRRSPRRPALSIARANCSMTLVGGTDSRCERRRSCQCASTTKW